MGWRAFLLEKIREEYGDIWSIILTGVIWGVWHYSAMIILGYGNVNIYSDNYNYILPKMMGYTLFTVLVGATLAYSYWLTNNILIPSGIHGAVNAYWGLTLLTSIDEPYFKILADTISWVIVTLPLLIIIYFSKSSLTNQHIIF